MKIIINLLKKVVFAFAILYGFNLIMNSLNLYIPINGYTVSIVAVLGFPGLFVLFGLIFIL